MLRLLILDSTPVTDEALAALRRRLPDLSVVRIEYRVCRALDRQFTLHGMRPNPIPDQLARRIRSILAQYKRPDEYGTSLDGYLQETYQLRFATDAKVPVRYLPSLTGLKELDLTSTAADDETLRSVGRIKSLRTLSLSGTKVGDAGLSELKELTNLRELYLAGIPMTDAGLAQLENMQNLEVLDVSNTNMSGAALAPLERFAKLRLLHVIGTQVRGEDIEKLKRALPTCQISH
jgi:hypothetical protein